MGKTYNNTLNTIEVALGIERFLIAPYPTAFTAARVDISSPPAGFMDLGTIVEDSPVVRYTREYFELKTGLPRTLQYRKVVEVNAEIEFKVYSHSWWQSQFCLGNDTTITTVTTIASGSVTTQYYGKSTLQEFALLGVTDFINGDQVIHDFARVNPAANVEEAFKPSELSQMPFTFAAIGFIATIESCEHLIVGKRHYVNADGVSCLL